jgi:hypothetical protein
MDYAFLRADGVAQLQRLAGTTWTDHNAHDPGVTILEQFCYALTDLSYRINYDVEDLLGSGSDGEGAADNCLFSPSEVLTGNAVTITDFRKVVIDVEGVKNAWIEPVETHAPTPYFDSGDQVLYLQLAQNRKAISLRGLYRVHVEADQNVSNEDRSNLAQRVSQRLHTCRNLAEDFEPPIILDAQRIIVEAKVEIGHVDDPDQLLAQIHYALSGYVSPGIRFYTLAEMLARGKRMDEIMDGPVLDHGFIDTEELERSQRKSGLRTSDMIQLIMKIEGVRAVHQITVSDGHNEEAWYLGLDPTKSPVLADLNESLITLVRGKANATTDPSRVTTFLRALQEASRFKSLSDSQRDVPLPVGRDRHVEQYHSIQHQFPPVYGIGEFGLPSSASPTRQAQARQLKAYLMFFDQFLANAFSQLARVKDLFSVKSGVTQSYFTQALNTVPGVVDVLVSSDLASHGAAVQALAEDPETGVTRRNRFLNHLLARFGEEFDDSSLLDGAQAAEGLIEDKCAFLRDYPEIGAGRSRAFNYLLPSWDSNNISGLERRIARKLGLPSCRRRSLKDLPSDEDGGFHLVEHILLRPRSPDEAQGKDATVNGWQAYATLAKPLQDDPFSAQLTFVFPGWINRFADKGDNRSLIARLVREETPAHLKIRLCWLEIQNDMAAFEAAFRQMLEGLQTANIAAGAAPSA